MAKGIKKIKFVPMPNEANNSNSRFGPDKWVCVPANKKAHFYIKEWHKDTTEDQKKGKLYWMVLDKDRKNIVERLHFMTDKYFSYKIPKRLCGYTYYVEASMTGKPDVAFTGLMIIGYCDPLITTSKWSKTRGGTNIRNTESKNFGVSYGETIHFHADTEGINGEVVTVEVHNEMWSGDYKMRTIYNVEVKDGQINLEIPNTSQWKAYIKYIQENEEFYVKIKRKNGTYVKDKAGNDRHGKYLNIKNAVKAVVKTPPSNETPLIIGQPNTDISRVGTCKFKQIKINETDEFIVFEDGKSKIKTVGTTPLEQKHFVFFDFNKNAVRADAQKTLSSLVALLKSNPHSQIIIDGHADERGPGDYNLKLSQDRSEAVMNFMKSNGLGSSKFKCHGHGESQLIHKGTKLTEAQHQQNRRAMIRFNYYENNYAPIIFETIAPFAGKAKNLTVSAVNKERKGCRSTHKDEIIIQEAGLPKKTEAKNTVVYPVKADIGDDFIPNYLKYFGKYINYFSSMHKSYYFYINSCTYFPQKDKPTLQVKTYPDIVWLAHGKYDFEDDYFFHNHSVDLQQGFVTEFESFIERVYLGTSVTLVDYMAKQVLLDYIKSEAQKLQAGLHAIHNRTQEKKGAALSLNGTTVNFITQTKYTKYATSIAMFGFVCLQIVIEILILILTRGRSGISKLKKIKKLAKGVQKVMKAIESLPDSIELEGPSMAYKSGLYYYKQADGRVAMIFEAGIKIDPLIGVKYELVGKDLLDYVTDKTLKDKLPETKHKDFEDIRDKVKGTYEDKTTNISFSVSIVGAISIEQNVKYNFLTKTYSFSEQAGNYYDKVNGIVAFGQHVRGKAEVKSIFYKELFSFTPLKTQVKLEAKLEIDCSFGIVQQYGKDDGGFFVDNSLYFSGLKGKYKFKSEVKNQQLGIDWETSTDTDKGKEDKSFTIFKEKTITLYKIYLLKT